MARKCRCRIRGRKRRVTRKLGRPKKRRSYRRKR